MSNRTIWNCQFDMTVLNKLKRKHKIFISHSGAGPSGVSDHWTQEKWKPTVLIFILYAQNHENQTK